MTHATFKQRVLKLLFVGSVITMSLSLALWMASFFRTSYWMSQFGDSIGVRCGVVFRIWTNDQLRQRLSTQHGVPIEPDWHWHSRPRQIPMEWLPHYSALSSGRGGIGVPLWIPLLLSGAIIAWWIFLRRRAPAGACPRCRYPLTGLPIARPCPECGYLDVRPALGIGKEDGVV
jgi:hypothetical protein